MESSPLNASQIARRMLRGAALQGVAQYAGLVIGIIKIYLLFRLISVEIFGVVALATTYVSFLSIFRMELSPIVVTAPRHDPLRLSTQFALENASALTGVLLGGIIYFMAPLLEPVLGSLGSALHWQAIFMLLMIRMAETLTSTPVYILRRDIRFDILSRLTLLGIVLGAASAIVLALLGHPLLSLLADTALMVLVPGLGAWWITGWRPAVAWDRQVARDVFAFGFTVWTAGLLGKITFEFDDLLVGEIRGDKALGFYSKAYLMAKLPLDVFGGVIATMSTTLYSQSAAVGKAVLIQAYTLTTWLLTRIIALSSIVMMAATEDIILILAGSKWLPTVPLIRLMFVYVLGRPLFQNNAMLLTALRREKQFRAMVFIQALVLLLLGPPAVWWWGAEGVSVAVSIMMGVGLAISEWTTSRAVGISALPLYVLPAALVVILTPILYVLGPALSLPAFPSLVVKGVLASLLFGGCVMLFERQRAVEVLALVKRHFLKSESKTNEAVA